MIFLRLIMILMTHHPVLKRRCFSTGWWVI